MPEENENKNEEEKLEPAEAKGFPVKVFVIGILFLIFVAGGFFALKTGAFKKLLGKSEAQAIASQLADEGKNKDIGPIYPMQTFIVNLMGHTKSYLKIQMEFELDSEELKREIDRRLPQFRDRILVTLSSKSIEDIHSLEGKFQLRAELTATLNQHLNTGQITNIYFTDFIIQ